MKVALVCPYGLDRPGGVQAQAVELARRLGEAGHRAWVVAPGRGVPGAHLVGGTVGVRFNRSVAPVAIDPRAGLRTLEGVADADVIHIHEPLVPVVALAALLSRSPAAKVGTFHAAPGEVAGRLYRLGSPLAVRLLRRLDGVTAVSPVAAEPIRRLGLDPEIIPNAIDSGLYRGRIALRPGRVLFVGRDEPRKGLEVLLGAWAEVRRAVPEAELVVAGDAPGRSVPGVRFLGPVAEEDKRRLLAEAAVLCVPGLGEESFGIVALEGLAAGCAVVASSLPALRQVVGDAGVLVPPGDPAALAEALVGILRDAERAGELRTRGPGRAAHFDWTVVLPRYLAAYRKALR